MLPIPIIPAVVLLFARPRRWVRCHKRIAVALGLAYLALDWLGAAWIVANVVLPMWAMVLR